MGSQRAHHIIKGFREVGIRGGLFLELVEEFGDAVVGFAVFVDEFGACGEEFLHDGVDYEFFADMVTRKLDHVLAWRMQGGEGGWGMGMYLPDELVGYFLLFVGIAEGLFVIVIILLELIEGKLSPTKPTMGN